MRISYNWIQSFFDEKLPEPKKVADILIFHAFEVESVGDHEGDFIFDVKVLPNRAHDCLSHLGIAKEIALIEGLKIKRPIAKAIEPTSGIEIAVSIDDPKLCERYISIVIEGVKIGPAPQWLRERLEAIGQRSINNVVDTANYIMFSVGQPIHAFDCDKLDDKIIRVRNARRGERMTTLDNKEVILEDSMTVIADDSSVLGLAGIKGGKKAEITDKTVNIILEAAKFDPVLIRRSSRKTGIRTDASHRFENEISADLPSYAMDIFTGLVIEIAGGKAGERIDAGSPVRRELPKRVGAKEVNALLGTNYSEREVRDVQERIDYEFRMDIERPVDLIEEVGRVLGYENVPSSAPTDTFPTPAPLPGYYYAEQLRQHLAFRGYSEVSTYVFAASGDLELKNSLQGDRNFMRNNLAESILPKFDLNKLNIDVLGLAEVKIFEIGKVFLKDREEVRCVLISSGKASVANDIPWPVGNLYEDNANLIEFCLDDVVAHLPEPQDYRELSASHISNATYKPFSPYPFSPRDIALFVPQDTSEDEVAAVIVAAAGELLIRNPRCFDRFEKKFPDENRKISYAFRLIFQSYERTLTNDEVSKIMEKIASAVEQKGWQVR